jgi:putative ABC transport system ATP-binding protein
MTANDEILIQLDSVGKVFTTEDMETHALSDVQLTIRRGEYVSIEGPSGSGKTTLLSILGLLDTPSSGTYLLGGKPAAGLSPRERALMRNLNIGFVFQSFNLIPRADAIANVELPLIYAGARNRRNRARAALERVWLGGRLHHMPNALSGGEQQRVAIARALVTDPKMILADEPTGNLDSHATTEIMDLFCELNHEGHTIVLITHERDVAALARRVVLLEDGRIVSDNPTSGALVG